MFVPAVSKAAKAAIVTVSCLLKNVCKTSALGGAVSPIAWGSHEHSCLLPGDLIGGVHPAVGVWQEHVSAMSYSYNLLLAQDITINTTTCMASITEDGVTKELFVSHTDAENKDVEIGAFNSN